MVPKSSCVQFGAVSILFCNRSTDAIHLPRDFFAELTFPDRKQRQLRPDSPIYGRVYSRRASPAIIEFTKQSSPILEVEYQALLGADLPPRRYTVDEVTDAVASLHPWLELAECRFAHDERKGNGELHMIIAAASNDVSRLRRGHALLVEQACRGAACFGE
jgi:hypothetical protein